MYDVPGFWSFKYWIMCFLMKFHHVHVCVYIWGDVLRTWSCVYVYQKYVHSSNYIKPINERLWRPISLYKVCECRFIYGYLCILSVYERRFYYAFSVKMKSISWSDIRFYMFWIVKSLLIGIVCYSCRFELLLRKHL